MTMQDHSFDDGEAYERFMGCWSRAVAKPFLCWLAAPPRSAWLDVGCGTGAFTRAVLDHAGACCVAAVDPSAAQVAFARRQILDEQARFEVADAQALPFAAGCFDVVGSALVLNFVADRGAALGEMKRVARPGALIAAYVWDFEAELSPSGPLRAAMRRIGATVPPMPGSSDSTTAALTGLFLSAGLEDVSCRQIEVAATFRDFPEYWQAQTPSYSPMTKVIDDLAPWRRTALVQAVQAMLPTAKDGTIQYAARANTVKGRVPAR